MGFQRQIALVAILNQFAELTEVVNFALADRCRFKSLFISVPFAILDVDVHNPRLDDSVAVRVRDFSVWVKNIVARVPNRFDLWVIEAREDFNDFPRVRSHRRRFVFNAQNQVRSLNEFHCMLKFFDDFVPRREGMLEPEGENANYRRSKFAAKSMHLRKISMCSRN